MVLVCLSVKKLAALDFITHHPLRRLTHHLYYFN